MELFIKENPQDRRPAREELQQGYGNPHPEKTVGFPGLFFSLGDVYLSDNVSYRIHHSASFREFVVSCLRDFEQDRYGLISSEDYDNNIEDKWISGGYDLFGRYAFGQVRSADGLTMPKVIIKVRYLKGKTYVLFDSELDCLIHS